MDTTTSAPITNRTQWHAWFDQRRQRLHTRLEQAQQAEWNWPSTRRRMQVHELENEIKSLDDQEFVVPF